MKPYILFVHSRRSINLSPFKMYKYYLFDRYLNPIIHTDSKEELKIIMDLRDIHKIKKYEIYRSYFKFKDAKIVFE